MTQAVASSALKVARKDSPLVDQPINPDWILEGTPHARVSEWGESPDVRKQAVVRVPVPRTMRNAVNGIGRRTHRLR